MHRIEYVNVNVNAKYESESETSIVHAFLPGTAVHVHVM